MSLKGFLLLVPIAAGGWYMAGGSAGECRATWTGRRRRSRRRSPIWTSASSRDAGDRSGRIGRRACGVPPRADGRGIVFIVYSRDKVATRMIAHLEPLDGGRRTRVWAEVERGDAPDELVSPAFRSTGITLGPVQRGARRRARRSRLSAAPQRRRMPADGAKSAARQCPRRPESAARDRRGPRRRRRIAQARLRHTRPCQRALRAGQQPHGQRALTERDGRAADRRDELRAGPADGRRQHWGTLTRGGSAAPSTLRVASAEVPSLVPVRRTAS